MRDWKLVLVLLFLPGLMMAQNVEFKAANFKEKKEEFKLAMEQIEKGNEFLDLANESIALVKLPGDNFKLALQLYLKAQKLNSNNAELNMKIGNCYLYTNEKHKSIDHLNKAYELDKEVSPMLYFCLGQSSQLQYKFDEAIKHYKSFEERAKSKYVEEYKKITGKYKKECKYGKEFYANPDRAWVDNIKSVNSEWDDYSPCLSADGELLMFTSRRENGHSKNSLG